MAGDRDHREQAHRDQSPIAVMSRPRTHVSELVLGEHHFRQQRPRGHGDDGGNDGDAHHRQPPAPHQAHGCGERTTDHQCQAGPDVDRRGGPSGMACRHQSGGDGGDNRPQQAMGDRTQHPSPRQHREVGRQCRDCLRRCQTGQTDHQRTPAGPVRCPAHQRNRCQGRYQRIPGQQGPHQDHADL